MHSRPGSFPWATFWTNISGSLVIGFLLVLLVERFPPSRYLRPFVVTGFLGAYTTYSTFAVETVLLVKGGHAAVALAYAIGSQATGLLAVWTGVVAGRFIPLRANRTRSGRG